MVVDSGASETVLPKAWFNNVPLKEREGSKIGEWYRAANGGKIYNLGERTLNMSTLDGQQHRQMTFQVCDTRKALGSVCKMVHNGNRVVFDINGSYVENVKDGSRIPLRERGGVYVMDMWVAPNNDTGGGKQDFTRQGGAS